MAEGYRSQTAVANDHDFSITYTGQFDNDQGGVDLITPSSGKLLKITGVYISTEGATTIGQNVRLYFADGGIYPAITGDTVITFFPSAVSNVASSIALDSIIVRGSQNEALKITSNLGKDKNYFIIVNYKEE